MEFKSKYVLVLLLCFITACNTTFIPKEQQVKAMGIFKPAFVGSKDWAHVATIHGWNNDLEACLEIVEFLNTKEPDQYICSQLME